MSTSSARSGSATPRSSTTPAQAALSPDVTALRVLGYSTGNAGRMKPLSAPEPRDNHPAFSTAPTPPGQPPVRAVIRDSALDAVGVLLPVSCAGCKTDGRGLCSNCVLLLAPVGFRQRLVGGLEILSALRYEGPVRSVILEYKEHGRTDVAAQLARPFAAVIRAATRRAERAGGRTVELVAVPPSRQAFQRRGFDPVALLARHARSPLTARILARPAVRGSQKALDVEQRALNAAFSLRARGPLGGRKFLLIDDVVTSGATLREATRALEQEGAEVVGAATLAVTFKRLDVL